jgi:hypothetical protein
MFDIYVEKQVQKQLLQKTARQEMNEIDELMKATQINKYGKSKKRKVSKKSNKK